MLSSLSLSMGNNSLDSLFIYSKGMWGGNGFLLISRNQKLTKFIEYEPKKIGDKKEYLEREIMDSAKVDSIFKQIGQAGYQKIKNQADLPFDSIVVMDGETICIRFKENGKVKEVEYNSPDSHRRKEDSIVENVWSSVLMIRKTCLAPLSPTKRSTKMGKNK
jgi:hypothetical protein